MTYDMQRERGGRRTRRADDEGRTEDEERAIRVEYPNKWDICRV